MDSATPILDSIVAGKYRLVRLLGAGGMGEVFEATNTDTHKRVAIKWMRPELARDREAAERFSREAQALSRIRHPNVVDVYDIIKSGESLFLVMELLEGMTLSAMIERGGKSIPELIALLLPAMRGVAKAHKLGVIHRDIKPDNIFLAHQEDGEPLITKVLDFGISKLRDCDNLTLTRTGVTIGTPLYMSLEQLTGRKDIDERTDVYSFGVVLYELVTGQPPFQAETFTELAVKIATTEPRPLKSLRPDLPGALSRLIQKAMAKDKEQRSSSLEELIRELEPFASEAFFSSQLTVETSAPALDLRSSFGRAPTDVAPSPVPASAGGPRPSAAPARALEAEGDSAQAAPTGAQPDSDARLRRMVLAVGVLALLAIGLITGLSLRPASSKDLVVPDDRKPHEPPHLDPPLAPAAVEVLLRSDPEPAAVLRAGVEIGETPLRLNVTGDDAVTLVARGYRPSPLTVTRAMAPAQLVKLERATAKPPTVGESHRVQLRTDPPGARVTSGGKMLGQTPLTVEVHVTLKVEIALRGYRTTTLTLSQSSPETSVVPLEREQAQPGVGGTGPSVADQVPRQPAAQPSSNNSDGRWKPLPMPTGGGVLGAIFNSGARTRRKRMLQHGPPYRTAAAAQAAFRARTIDEETYDDTLWTLRVLRSHLIEEAKLDRDAGAIDAATYRARVAHYDSLYLAR